MNILTDVKNKVLATSEDREIGRGDIGIGV